MTPWTDRAGKFSPLKAAVLALTLAPAIWLIVQTSAGWLGARPLTEAIHQTGDWAIRFLLLSLAVTPLRRIGQWPKLINVRRMLGVTAFLYAFAHLTLYVADQSWRIGFVVSEIALRFYLTIGFVALVGLAVLAATSTDAMIRRLGGAWNRLHKIVYAIAILGLLHFLIQSKLDVYEATLMVGLFFLSIGYRLAHNRGFALSRPLVLASVGIVAAIATVVAEFAWYGLTTNVPAMRVLAANWQFSLGIRPAAWVLVAGLGVAAVGYARTLTAARGPARGRAPARASQMST